MYIKPNLFTQRFQIFYLLIKGLSGITGIPIPNFLNITTTAITTEKKKQKQKKKNFKKNSLVDLLINRKTDKRLFQKNSFPSFFLPLNPPYFIYIFFCLYNFTSDYISYYRFKFIYLTISNNIFFFHL